MHPLLSQPKRVLALVLVWVAAGLLLGHVFQTVDQGPWLRGPLGWTTLLRDGRLTFTIPISIVYGFVVLSAWWVCRGNPLSGGGSTRAMRAHGMASLLASAAWVVVANAWAAVLAMGFKLRPDQICSFQEYALMFALGIPAYLASAGAHYLYLALEASHTAERRVLEAQVTAREAELRALRAQLNPHFLFNSLNSINALVGIDPEGARRMSEGLGDFLRRTLSLGAREAVTLSEELALVDRYLAIEQVRFGERLAVERTIEPGTMECRVPPLLLQPLVENAVKHGVSSRIEGGTVRIEARRRGEWLILAIENPLDEQGPSRVGEGVGLENVRRRLAVLGSRDARLEIIRASGRFRVELTLQATGAGVADAPAPRALDARSEAAS